MRLFCVINGIDIGGSWEYKKKNNTFDRWKKNVGIVMQILFFFLCILA